MKGPLALLLGFCTKCNQGRSEATKLDNSVDRKKGLVGIKLPKLCLGEGQGREKGKLVETQVDFMRQSPGWGL